MLDVAAIILPASVLAAPYFSFDIVYSLEGYGVFASTGVGKLRVLMRHRELSRPSAHCMSIRHAVSFSTAYNHSAVLTLDIPSPFRERSPCSDLIAKRSSSRCLTPSPLLSPLNNPL